MVHVSGACAILAALVIVVVLIRFRDAITSWVFIVTFLACASVWELWTGKRIDD